MGKSEIKLGDKIFLYGQLLTQLEYFDEYEYNAVMGYMTVGGYYVKPIKTDFGAASVPGFVVDAPVNEQFTVAAPFNQIEMADITENLALSLPLLSGSRVWMPTIAEL